MRKRACPFCASTDLALCTEGVLTLFVLCLRCSAKGPPIMKRDPTEDVAPLVWEKWNDRRCLG
jgi:hypothetical protein